MHSLSLMSCSLVPILERPSLTTQMKQMTPVPNSHSICTHLALEFSIEHISSPSDILTHLFVFSQLDCQLHESRISVYVVHCLVSLKPRTVAGTEYVL